MMKTKLAAVAFSALTIGGLGMGVAHAAGAPATPKAPVVSQSAPSTAQSGVDSGANVQQGSQTAPDTTTGAETTGTEAASTAADPAGVDSGPNVQQGSQTAPDTTAGAETTGTEAADPAGVDSGPNVQQGSQSGPDVAGNG